MNNNGITCNCGEESSLGNESISTSMSFAVLAINCANNIACSTKQNNNSKYMDVKNINKIQGLAEKRSDTPSTVYALKYVDLTLGPSRLADNG